MLYFTVADDTTVLYTSTTITPDPSELPWPRDRGTSIWCPPHVTVQFTYNSQHMVLQLELNTRLYPDSLPLFVAENGVIHKWSVKSKVHTK